MAWQKKKHAPAYLTEADKERIARIDCNPHTLNRKFKSLMTLKRKGLEQEICIYVYGKSEEDVREKAKEREKAFQAIDSKWKMSDLKSCYMGFPGAAQDEKKKSEEK